MRLTEVRCYVLVKLAADGKLTVERNGALEPSLKGFYQVGGERHPFSEKRLLTAVQDLYHEGYLRFADRGLHGVYKGLAELTMLGRHWCPTALAKLEQFAELRERQAAERAAFEQKRTEELAAFEEANQVLADDQPDEDSFVMQRLAAAERVRAFLDRHAKRNIAEKNVIFRVDDHILHAGDLALLCDAVAGTR